MKTGIYIIRNLDNNKVYIGQSTDVTARLTAHKGHLKAGNHPNTYLQRAYDSHNGHFSFKLLEECPEESLDEREVFWIDYYHSIDRDRGYNRETGGHAGKHWCDESREQRSGRGNPMYGKKHSQEFVEYIRMKNRASSDKLTEADVIDIKKRLIAKETQAEISRRYGVKVSTINKIAVGANWDWVAPELNEAIISLLPSNTKGKRNQILIDSFKSGKTVEECAKIAGCGLCLAYTVLSPYIDAEKAKRTALIKDVQQDFKLGLSKEEIMRKYGISKTSYVRYTTDLYNERKRRAISEVHRLRKSGMMVKDIAEKLGLHRTTVTAYLKLESW